MISTGGSLGALAKQLGDYIPLDTEREYNVTYAKGAAGFNHPVPSIR
jgi:hypothetical protein